PDTTAPALVIAAPASGLSIPGTNGAAQVTLEGTASDDRVLDRVEVAVDNGPWVRAEPRTGNSLASWVKELTVPVGTHALRPRAFDQDGNTTTRDVRVTVEAGPPPDSTGPVVTISSPAKGSAHTGPFSGASITLNGTAEDANGIGEVSLHPHGGPIGTTARL